MKRGRRTTTRWAALLALVAIGCAGCVDTDYRRSVPSGHAVIESATSGAVGRTPGSGTPDAPPAGRRSIPEAAFAVQPAFTGAAVRRYGQRALRAAYEELVNFAFLSGWDPRLIVTGPTHLARADLALTRSYLTPACARSLDRTVAGVVQGDAASIRRLDEAVFFGVAGPRGMRPIRTGHVVTDRRFTRASVAVDHGRHGDRLVMAFAVRANIHLQDPSGARHVLATGRVVRYWLVPAPAPVARQRAFLVDAWAIKTSARLVP